MINKEILEALKTLEIPVIYKRTSKKYDKYIIFSYYNEVETDKVENTNLSETYYITMNYWCINDSDIFLYKEIIKLMKQKDFIFDGSEDIEDEKYNGKNIDFIYSKVKEEYVNGYK